MGSLYNLAAIGTIGLKSSFSLKNFFVSEDILTKFTDCVFDTCITSLPNLLQIGLLYRIAVVGTIDSKLTSNKFYKNLTAYAGLCLGIKTLVRQN